MTVPPSRSVGDSSHVTDHNNIRGVLLQIEPGPAGLGSTGAWASYTPTIGENSWSLGNGTASGRYMQLGKMVTFDALITFGSSSAFGASFAPAISLPVAQYSGIETNIRCAFTDSSAGNRYWGATVYRASASVWVYVVGTDGVNSSTNATTPFTWNGTDADTIRVFGTYEAA